MVEESKGEEVERIFRRVRLVGGRREREARGYRTGRVVFRTAR